MTPWTVAYETPLFMELSRQEYCRGLSFSSPGDCPNPEIEPRSPKLQVDSLQTEPPGKIQRKKVKGLENIPLKEKKKRSLFIFGSAGSSLLHGSSLVSGSGTTIALVHGLLTVVTSVAEHGPMGSRAVQLQ